MNDDFWVVFCQEVQKPLLKLALVRNEGFLVRMQTYFRYPYLIRDSPGELSDVGCTALFTKKFCIHLEDLGTKLSFCKTC